MTKTSGFESRPGVLRVVFPKWFPTFPPLKCDAGDSEEELGPLAICTLACHRTQSDDSSSSIGELMISRDKGMSSLHQSDSDDIAIAGGIRHHLTPFSLRSRQVPHLHGNFESDSFNENFSPIHPNTRRYRCVPVCALAR
ncbi:unnamed protein product [Timema podura]|uniref:Uncharacterized protein n=1 Tax=Timema podura TaxID=61482 RepID=A0ABN7P665_TIMPD|nr:unnamed protein product [Timema podura]